jgi:hypothetical protein
LTDLREATPRVQCPEGLLQIRVKVVASTTARQACGIGYVLSIAGSAGTI